MLDADNLTTLEKLVEAQLMTRAVEKAHTNARRLLSIDPDHFNGRYLVGSIELWGLGQHESAIGHWRRLLELAPEHPKASQVRRVLEAYDAGERSLKELRQRFLNP